MRIDSWLRAHIRSQLIQVVEEIVTPRELATVNLHERVKKVGVMQHMAEWYLRWRAAYTSSLLVDESIRAGEHGERYVPYEAIDCDEVGLELRIRPRVLAKDRIHARRPDILEEIVEEGALKGIVDVTIASHPRPRRPRTPAVGRWVVRQLDGAVEGSLARRAEAGNALHDQQTKGSIACKGLAYGRGSNRSVGHEIFVRELGNSGRHGRIDGPQSEQADQSRAAVTHATRAAVIASIEGDVVPPVCSRRQPISPA